MRYAVIDVGTDTIKETVYEMEKGEPVRLYREEETLGLLDFVEENRLTEEGLAHLSLVVGRMSETAQMLKCGETCCFSTAALRYLENKEWVEENLYQRYGLSVDVLTSQRETSEILAGLLRRTGETTMGIGCDVGGGATQLFIFSQARLEEMASIPAGGLRYCRMFVKGLLPVREEIEKMRQYTLCLLEDYPALLNQNSRTLHLTGGTACLVKVLGQAIGGRGIDTLTLQDLDILAQTLRGGGIRSVDLLERILPGRAHTVLPSLIILQTIGAWMDLEGFTLWDCGTSEGYLLEKMETGVL